MTGAIQMLLRRFNAGLASAIELVAEAIATVYPQLRTRHQCERVNNDCQAETIYESIANNLV